MFMPYIGMKTNIKLDDNERTALKAAFGTAIENIPGKSENWLMVAIEDEVPLWFRGDGDRKLACLEVRLFGKAKNEAYDRLTAALCDLMDEKLGISRDGIYVIYHETDHWGWNGANF